MPKTIGNVNNLKAIPFFSTARQHARLADALAAATQRVLQSNNYILGAELLAFEQAWAQFCGVQYAIGVANGTDAITIALLACGIGSGDEVITAANTSPFTALAITTSGATPVFVDIGAGSFSMDVTALATACTPRTKAIVPVHLYGQPADILGVMAFAQTHGLHVIEDACQAHGARVNGQRVGSFGSLGTFSFYPTKNLGALGDAGAITTNDPTLAERARQLRNGGRVDRDHHALRGINSRLDELQAAMLSVKLPHLDQWNVRRRAIAQRYTQALGKRGWIAPPPPDAIGVESVHHLYVVRTPQRDALRQHLLAAGIGSLVHYPIPLHQHGAFKSLGYEQDAFPNATHAAQEIVSLPLYPELTDDECNQVIHALLTFNNSH